VGVSGARTPPLAGPLRALLNLLPVSRGETVAGEILGSGNPGIASQEFALARGPLTYLTDTDPGPFDGYRSTLRVRVSGIEWREVASFYEQPPEARVYATREDEAQRTYVRFGDGVNGARVPAGIDNVIADYRVGSGAVVPPIGALTTVLRPQPGLASIRNPIPPGGGADPDSPDQIRRYAPRSVLTFGRAVSGDDYETIAAQTPGVTRARAVWGWDAASQRSTVKVLVGDDDAAVIAARDALRSFADPNRPVAVALASPMYADLSLTLEVDRDRDPETVRAAVSAVLLDPLAPPFGAEVARIGQPIYNSEIYDACLGVAGTVAVHGLVFASTLPATSPWPTLAIPGFSSIYIIDPALAAASPMAVEHTERHVPGDDRYYVLRADRLHLSAEASHHGH
jgi:predicted phage baseplate assembly protein